MPLRKDSESGQTAIPFTLASYHLLIRKWRINHAYSYIHNSNTLNNPATSFVHVNTSYGSIIYKHHCSRVYVSIGIVIVCSTPYKKVFVCLILNDIFLFICVTSLQNSPLVGNFWFALYCAIL